MNYKYHKKKNIFSIAWRNAQHWTVTPLYDVLSKTNGQNLTGFELREIYETFQTRFI